MKEGGVVVDVVAKFSRKLQQSALRLVDVLGHEGLGADEIVVVHGR